MLIFALDDEPLLLRSSERAIREAYPDAEVLTFESADGALAAIKKGRQPNAVFSDIEMPGMSGLDLAIQIKMLCPSAWIIFVTGFSQYAVEAYQVHAQGYIKKPLRPERVREELESLAALPKTGGDPNKLRIQCFGRFEVFWHGEPLLFQRKQTKELFAYLVDRRGSMCTSEEIALALWEEEDADKAVKNRIRVLINDLRATLRAIGMEEVLLRKQRQIALRTDRVECDYYRMRAGDMDAVNEFRGSYMEQYSWAEMTAGQLYFAEFDGDGS